MGGQDNQTTSVVVMMCGVAGSGKTTHALVLEGQGYIRLSIDEEIWRRYGASGADLDPDEYEQRQSVAEHDLLAQLDQLIAQRRNVVLDYSFWNRDTRNRYKKLIEGAGARWELIYLAVDAATLRERIQRRNREDGPNSVFVSDALLLRYQQNFEEPTDEGQTTIQC